jgi:threonine synthase
VCWIGGIGCEPASATSVAGVRHAVASGVIGRDESVVAVLTGHLLKDPMVDESASAAGDRNTPVEIDSTLSALEAELQRIQL